jgi:hypothetical protein
MLEALLLAGVRGWDTLGCGRDPLHLRQLHDERQLYIPADDDWISRSGACSPAAQRRLDFPTRCTR